MRTFKIVDMHKTHHEIDVTFVEDIVNALDGSRLLDDVIASIPLARIKKVIPDKYLESGSFAARGMAHEKGR